MSIQTVFNTPRACLVQAAARFPQSTPPTTTPTTCSTVGNPTYMFIAVPLKWIPRHGVLVVV
jgi:hypothetical protein